MCHLVSKGRLLQRNVLVLASLQDLFVDAVQADGVRIRLSGDLVVLAGQVLHAAHLSAKLVDVTYLANPPNALPMTALVFRMNRVACKSHKMSHKIFCTN